MIIKNFKENKDTIAAVDYLLSMKDHMGRTRDVAPEVLMGSPEFTKELHSLCLANKRAGSEDTANHQSGAIAFRKNEKPTREQMLAICEDFERKVAGNLYGKVNCLWVLHQDKGNTELHFCFNRVVCEGTGFGKHWCPMKPGDDTYKFKDAFRDIWNDRLGYEPVKQKTVFKTFYSADERKALDKPDTKTSFTQLKGKLAQDKFIQQCIKDAGIKNRAELIEFLKESGFKINRCTSDSISIDTGKTKLVKGKVTSINIRLKGGFYEDGKDYADRFKEFQAEKAKPLDIEKAHATLKRVMADRDEFNTKRYLRERIPYAEYKAMMAAKKLASPNDAKAAKALGSKGKPVSTFKIAQTPSISANTEMTPARVSNAAFLSQFSDSHEKQKTPEHTAAAPAISGGVASALMSLASAEAELATAKTPEARIRAEQKVREAQRRVAEEAEKAKAKHTI